MSKFLDMTGLTHFKNKMINVVNSGLNNKVDKVTGKSLISDTEIARLAKVDNYDDSGIKADIQTNADNIDTNKTNISTLAKHMTGDLTDSDFQEDSTVAMTKTVPSGMGDYAAISKISGKTQKVVQLISDRKTWTNGSTVDSKTFFMPVIQSRASTSSTTVTESLDTSSTSATGLYQRKFKATQNAGAVYIKHNGTTKDILLANNEANIVANHSYIFSCNIVANNPSANNGLSLTNVMLFDITAMGFAESTTLEQFNAAIKEYVAYGSYLWNAPVESVVSTSADGTTETTLLLPDSDRNLSCFGYGIDETIQNVRDYENGTYTQMVAEVDLGNLADSMYFNQSYSNHVIGIRISAKASSVGICSKYSYVSPPPSGVTNMTDKSFAIGSDGQMYIRDSSITDTTDVTQIKSVLSGTKAVYQLATPVVTECSDILHPIRCEAGGTITFNNEHNLDIPNTVIYKKEVSLS